jgi:hypothetical protein
MPVLTPAARAKRQQLLEDLGRALRARVHKRLEKNVEARFVWRCTERGALARKMLGRAGDPDRQVFAPLARTCLVELKRRGEKARKLQRKRHRQFRALGFDVYVLDTIEKVDRWAARWFRQ